MKKRNLNFLLALLAALALVFAGACSDGSDDDTSGTGGNENTPGSDETTETYTVAGKTFTYAGDESTAHSSTGATYLGSVALSFTEGSTTGQGTVAMSVQYIVCGGGSTDGCGYTSNDYKGVGGVTAGKKSDGTTALDGSSSTDSCILYTASVTGATYTEDTSAKTVTVTLPADSDSSNANATLTFSVDSSNNKLTLTSALTSDSKTLETYTVKGGTDTTGCNILASEGVTGALTASSTGGSEFDLETDSDDNQV